MSMILDESLRFPDPATANHRGLVAIGGDISVPRLLLAYRQGIFPWSIHPVTWWSPDPRAIFELEQFHVSRSLRALLRRRPFEITVNRAFARVVAECAATHKDGVWISPEFVEAYTRLHEAGHAHSLECWAGGRLVGGIYGVTVGGLFAGESMFHHVSNASKVALCHLVDRLRDRGYALFDIQMITPVTGQMGAVDIPRADYLRRLRRAVELDCRFAD